ncbi:MAG: hypothetical protein LBM66_06315 [Bifidobacteriaceae bacterium]|jgi:hypothetical protein|nr:hypothetical protein [Bifidobacteriaceae bacterium]
MAVTGVAVAAAPSSGTPSPTPAPGVVAQAAPKAETLAETAPALSATAGQGVLAAASGKVVWGGATGKALKAGKAKAVKLKGISAKRRQLLLQVNVTRAKRAGTLQLRTAGTASGPAQVAFPKGASSTQVFVTASAAKKLTATVSKKATVQLSLAGTVSGAADQTPGPGGTGVLAAGTVADSVSGLGGTLAGKGHTTNVPVAGTAGVPSTGVRAVWLDVQTLGGAAGSVAFRKSDGGASKAAAATVVKHQWATSLVLAPLDQEGRIAYRPSVKLSRLRMVVTGWVPEAASTSSVSTEAGGLVDVAAKGVKAKAAGAKAGAKIVSVKVTGGAVPSKAKSVLVRVSGKTGAKAGLARAASSKAGAVRKSAAGARVAAKARASALLVGKVGAKGTVWLAVPKGTGSRRVAGRGWRRAAVKKKADKAAPKLTLSVLPGGGSIQLGTTPQVGLTGTVADPGSGVDVVNVKAGATELGTATLDTTKYPATWRLATVLPPGTDQVTATATDNAGRVSQAARTATVTAPVAGSTVVSPEVDALTPAQNAQVASVTNNQVVFNGTPLLTPGQILVSSGTAAYPDGFMRRVVSVQVQGGQTVVATTNATLEDVILQADITIKDGKVTSGDGKTIVAQGVTGGGTGAGNSRSLKDITANPGIKFNPSIPLFTLPLGSAGSSRLSIDLSAGLSGYIKIAWPNIQVWKAKLTNFKLEFSGSAGLTLDTELNAQISKTLKKDLGEIRIGSFPIGVVPVNLSLDPTASIGVDAKAKVSETSDATAGIDVGVDYENGGWNPIWNPYASLDVGAPSANASVGANASAGLKFAAKIADVAGPYAEAGATAGATITAGSDACGIKYEGKVGLDAKVGVSASVFGISLGDWSKTIASKTLVDKSGTLAAAGCPTPSTPSASPTTPPVTEPTGGTSPEPSPSGSPLTGITQITAGDQSAYALNTNGQVYAWGLNGYGELGDGTRNERDTPELIPGLTDITQITAAGGGAVFALNKDGQVYAWGWNGTGELGDGTTTDHHTPEQVPGLTDITQITAGYEAAYALNKDGQVYAWGINDFGQLGDGTTTDNYTPQLIPGLTGITQITANVASTYALDTNGQVYAWGWNMCGQLGDGTTTDSYTPVLVLAPTGSN